MFLRLYNETPFHTLHSLTHHILFYFFLTCYPSLLPPNTFFPLKMIITDSCFLQKYVLCNGKEA